VRQTSCVLYIAVDALTPEHGKAIAGFDEFTAALDHEGIPAVWLTSRSRPQFDEPRRKLGHAHPFIAEDGCGVYLPEDYFHLRPDSAGPRSAKASTLRLGRFTCIPAAEPLPAAADALEALSEETGVPIVTLRSLSLRELAQNTGLPAREAELARQRDFDELFFFAGASDSQVDRFLAEGGKRRIEFRQHGVLWSAAIGASIQRCVAALSKLYDRALRYHAPAVGMATADFAQRLLPCCDRSILLTDGGPKQDDTASSITSMKGRMRGRSREIPLAAPELWERVLESVVPKSHAGEKDLHN
jgi:predicted mannosyl-3-phosphoglycerate phosphatase (HAD superfamily)